MHSDLCYTEFFSAWRFNAGLLPLICGRYSALGDARTWTTSWYSFDCDMVKSVIGDQTFTIEQLNIPSMVTGDRLGRARQGVTRGKINLRALDKDGVRAGCADI
jgi:hypothetical protein